MEGLSVSYSEIELDTCETLCDLYNECKGNPDFHANNFAESLFAKALAEGREVYFEEDGTARLAPLEGELKEAEHEDENHSQNKLNQLDSPALGDPHRGTIYTREDGSIDLIMSDGNGLLANFDHELGGYDEYVAAIQTAYEGGIGIKDHYSQDGFLTHREYFERSHDRLYILMSFEEFEKPVVEKFVEVPELYIPAKVAPEKATGEGEASGIYEPTRVEFFPTPETSEAATKEGIVQINTEAEQAVSITESLTLRVEQDQATAQVDQVTGAVVAVETGSLNQQYETQAGETALQEAAVVYTVDNSLEITGISIFEEDTQTQIAAIAPAVPLVRTIPSAPHLSKTKLERTVEQVGNQTQQAELEQTTDSKPKAEIAADIEDGASALQDETLAPEYEAMAMPEATDTLTETDHDQDLALAPDFEIEATIGVEEVTDIETAPAQPATPEQPVAPELGRPVSPVETRFDDGLSGIDLAPDMSDPIPTDRGPEQEPEPTSPPQPEISGPTAPESGPIDEEESLDYSAIQIEGVEMDQFKAEDLEVEPTNTAPAPPASEAAPPILEHGPVTFLRSWIKNPDQSGTAPHIYRVKSRPESETAIVRPTARQERTIQTLEILASLKQNRSKNGSSPIVDIRSKITTKANAPRQVKKLAA